MDDRFGGGDEEGWGRKKLTNSKKADTESLKTPSLAEHATPGISPIIPAKKPKQFVDANNKFTILNKD